MEERSSVKAEIADYKRKFQIGYIADKAREQNLRVLKNVVKKNEKSCGDKIVKKQKTEEKFKESSRAPRSSD
jgi:chorismate mutase